MKIKLLNAENYINNINDIIKDKSSFLAAQNFNYNLNPSETVASMNQIRDFLIEKRKDLVEAITKYNLIKEEYEALDIPVPQTNPNHNLLTPANESIDLKITKTTDDTSKSLFYLSPGFIGISAVIFVVILGGATFFYTKIKVDDSDF